MTRTRAPGTSTLRNGRRFARTTAALLVFDAVGRGRLDHHAPANLRRIAGAETGEGVHVDGAAQTQVHPGEPSLDGLEAKQHRTEHSGYLPASDVDERALVLSTGRTTP